MIMENGKPKFLEHIQVSAPKIADMGKFEINTLIKPVKNLDDAICVEIIKMAKEEGINDLWLLSKSAIVSALEKQIPKKATEETINRGIDISGEYDIDFNLCCPNCSAIVGTFEGEVDEYYFKYCPTCGQALDWSDTE